MKLSNFIAGIETLKLYYDDLDGFHIGAEHDEFFMYATNRPLSKEDAKRMFDLGWRQPDGRAEGQYDPNEGWACFT